MKGIIFSTLLLLASCGTSQSLRTKARERKVNDHLYQKLSHLEVQIIHLNSMINEAMIRKETTAIDQSLIDSEIYAYEAQKNALLSQKTSLETSINQ